MRGGLTGRMLIASGLVAMLIGAVFTVLLLAIDGQRDSAGLARHSQEVLATGNRLERLLIDVETGERGFLLTRDESFLAPWQAAQLKFPEVSMALEELADSPAQRDTVQRIVRGAESYVQGYSIPVVEAARRGEPVAQDAEVALQGKALLDDLRREFDALESAESRTAIERQAVARDNANRAIIAAVGGLTGSILLIAVFSVYLTRSIVRPVRQAAGMAGRFADGDLATRMPETGVAEIGVLERSFNAMGRSLERNRDELARLVEEQMALRRVATLVAYATPPPEVFAAVIDETARLLDAGSTRLLRFEADGTATVLASQGVLGEEMPVGTRVVLEGRNVAALVRESGRAERMDDFDEAAGPLAALLRRRGVRSAVAAPINVEGRLWGTVTAFSTRDEPLPADAEARLADFTDLIATAIANTQARADLAASRARVVAATDESRRRIERDLHDGTQQRLVSLALDLRTAEASVPAELSELHAELSGIANGLVAALDDLREISRGIHPAILSEGGLGPALKALARRSAVPVGLDVRIEGRLTQPVEVAGYYVAAEALANAAKHAQATAIDVEADVRDGWLHLSVRDDGIGGADPARGSGLIGLADRVEALGGTLTVSSPPGRGTRIEMRLPVTSA